MTEQHPEHDHRHSRDESNLAYGHEHDEGHDRRRHSGILALFREVLPFGHGDSHAETNIDSALESSARGKWALKVSLTLLSITALLQLVVVLLSGSVGLLADTIHNVGDALTAVPLWIAFVLGERRASRRYTYGLGRAEDIAGIIIVLIIFLSAIVALYESVDRLLHPQPIAYLGWVFVGGLTGFLGNEVVAVFRIRVGREIGSAALIADGQHARVDGFTSLAVAFGAIGVWLGYPLADPIVGILIALAILIIVKDAATMMFRRMLDGIEPEIVEIIELTAAAVPGVETVSTVKARWQGHRIHAEITIVVNEDLPTWQSHAIVEQARRDLFHGLPKLSSIVVHCDPCGHGGVDHHRSTAHHERLTATTHHE